MKLSSARWLVVVAAATLAPRVGCGLARPAARSALASLAPPRARSASVARTAMTLAPADAASSALQKFGIGGDPSAKLGVLLLSQGAPDSAVDLESYLFNIFQDPEVVTIPKSIGWAKTPLAWAIAKTSAIGLKASTDGLLDAVSISESQQLRTVQQQAASLEATLRARGVRAQAFIAMRYWDPYIPEAIAAIKEAGVTHLVILPLYPQFSLSTSGSSLRVLEDALDSDAGFRAIRNTVIPSWYKQPAYLDALAAEIAAACARATPEGGAAAAVAATSGAGAPAAPPAVAPASGAPAAGLRGALARLRGRRGAGEPGGADQGSAGPRVEGVEGSGRSLLPTVLFSAVSLPEKYVSDLGDPYVEQIELTATLAMARVRELTGLDYPYCLAYQGQAAQKPSVPNRIRWVGPDVEETIPQLAASGVRELVIVPISFLYEQRGTLYMQDNVYRGLALAAGMRAVERVPTLGASQQLVGALADAVESAIPSLVSDGSSLEQAVDRGIPMHLTVVNDLLEIQRKGTRRVVELVPQEQPWGLSKKEAREAELINGRLAMAALTLLVSQGVIVDRIFPDLIRSTVADVLPF